MRFKPKLPKPRELAPGELQPRCGFGVIQANAAKPASSQAPLSLSRIAFSSLNFFLGWPRITSHPGAELSRLPRTY